MDAVAAGWLGGAPAPQLADDAQRLALAWALKERAYATIYADLPLAESAANKVSTLGQQAATESARSELVAIAAWLGGAAEAGHQAANSLIKLDTAYQAFQALGQSRHAAASQVPKIIALSMLGRHDEALACARRTLAQFSALGDDGAAGKVEINLGSMLLRQDRYAEAADHYRRAAVRFARVGDRQHSVLADLGLAGALTWQFEFDEATRIYERAEARVRAHGLAGLQGVIDSSRGMLELHRGRHAQALRWLESALRIAEQQGPPQRLADARAELAEAYLALNLLPEAAALYEQAVEDCRANDAPVEQAWAAAQLGLTLARQGHDDPALERLAQARGLFDAQGNAVGAARLESHAAAISLRSGRPETALRQAGAAAGALAGSGMRGWWLEAHLLVAEAMAALRRDQEAWRSFEVVREHAGELAEVLARCLTGQGLLLRRRADMAGARARLEQAASAIETQHAGLNGDEFRTAYLTDKQGAYDALIELALDDTGPRAAAHLLACMERSRARALSLGLGRGDTHAEPDRAQAQRRESLRWLQQQGQQAAAAGDAPRAAALSARAREVETEALEAHRRSQAALADGLAAATGAGAPLSAATLQAELEAHEALVEYAWVGDRLAAVVMRRDRLRCFELDARGLGERVEQLRFQINSLRFGAPALRQHAAQMTARTTTHLRALHAQVWAPLADEVADAEHVVVAPHRALHYVPFGALHDGSVALLDRHALSLTPSAGLWYAGRAVPRRVPSRAVVVGRGGSQLPHVRTEVEAVGAVFGERAVVLLDERATLPALAAAVPGTHLLHLACHGQFRADSPYFSSLDLADGGLTLRDAAALPLAGAMVTLSACETGVSRVAPGDELLGLVRGFLMAGAPTVLATLWTVDDAGTASLMSDFYRALGAGQAPAQALRQAQLALRERSPHPYFWAPFALHGRA
jgi:CHAT domain-containing protein/tetratricopeptide (TPR) repeat protein